MESNKDISSAIREIISANFVKGDYFDSHTIINELMGKQYHQVYLNSFPTGCTVGQYHGMIAQKIEESNLAQKVQIEGKDVLIKTRTIYGEIKQNHLWKKL